MFMCLHPLAWSWEVGEEDVKAIQRELQLNLQQVHIAMDKKACITG